MDPNCSCATGNWPGPRRGSGEAISRPSFSKPSTSNRPFPKRSAPRSGVREPPSPPPFFLQVAPAPAPAPANAKSANAPPARRSPNPYPSLYSVRGMIQAARGSPSLASRRLRSRRGPGPGPEGRDARALSPWRSSPPPSPLARRLLLLLPRGLCQVCQGLRLQRGSGKVQLLRLMWREPRFHV
ncbi:Hypothetical predicted protein [Marmota monax]|uniref:Uncharacterized protein n=1 Tax=Marmota monax TaxID=9995 RepID=A0A5E4A4A5_MARMO|nr:Hypothetical predicted protein [Marmota monax]